MWSSGEKLHYFTWMQAWPVCQLAVVAFLLPETILQLFPNLWLALYHSILELHKVLTIQDASGSGMGIANFIWRAQFTCFHIVRCLPVNVCSIVRCASNQGGSALSQYILLSSSTIAFRSHFSIWLIPSDNLFQHYNLSSAIWHN